MLKIIAAASLLFTSVVLAFEQNDYHLKFERMELIRYNQDYVKQMNVVTFKYNRTTTVANITTVYKVGLANHTKVEVQAHKFASNEYRLFPLRFAFNFCSAILENDYGLKKFLNCGNFTACPTKIGTNSICNWEPDAHKFPPFIPAGQYMHNIKMFDNLVEVFFLRVYGTVIQKQKWE